MSITKLLKIRAQIKRKKPTFINAESKKIKKLSKRGWRKPTGLHNKMRHGFKGNRRCVRAGWGSPAEVKGLHRSGMEMIIVNNPKELEKINPLKQGIIIGASIGTKKRIQMLELALQKKISVLNIRDPAKFVEAKIQEKKKQKEDKIEKKTEKDKKKQEKPKKNIEQKVEKDLSEEDKKDKEKKELDKLLIKENQ